MTEELELSKDYLRELHVERGLSGRQVAKKLGISTSTCIRHLRKVGLYNKEQSYRKGCFSDEPGDE